MNLVQIAYRHKKEHYILLRGRETFYDDRYLITFGTPEEAAEWLRVNHPELTLDPDSAPKEINNERIK